MQRSDEALIFREILVKFFSLFDGFREEDLRKAEARSANASGGGRRAGSNVPICLCEVLSKWSPRPLSWMVDSLLFREL
jgi:hypothetical protein